MACRTCGNNGGVVWVNMFGVRTKLPCPRCTKVIDILNTILRMPLVDVPDAAWKQFVIESEKDETNKRKPDRTKTTHIPQKEYYDPETGEVKHYSYDDEITDTTIEDVLDG